MTQLFTIGPVQMSESTRQVRGRQIPYFRTSDFSDVMLENEALLKKFAKASDGTKAVFLTGSGTAAMEAVVTDCFDGRDRLLVIDGGTFGHRFAQICELHAIPHDVVSIPYGHTLNVADLNRFDATKYTGLLINIHETSTGQLYDLKMVSDFCKSHDLTFVVDAIGAFAADPIDMARFEIDALIVSSQKALALAPGLAMMLLSPGMLHRVEHTPPKTFYLNLQNHLDQGTRGQTPFTPAVGIVLELNQRLREIDTLGIDAEIKRVGDLATQFRKGLAALDVTIPSFPLSNALTPLFFPDGNAMTVFESLRNDHGIILNPNGGEMAHYALRVGHLGDLTPDDYKNLLALLAK